ncbi:hypothetical protein Y032_0014g2341 [Ancylostoma ceylanicum]|uniref:Uncharacterized protein n=1 Tax=Ancylostoma ceylanicum TaxID=53326 RepID=A0A016V9N4_9BILA|nr:hypothetical protein Y032_0014g2341 [Ancylostoma ceylanicum]
MGSLRLAPLRRLLRSARCPWFDDAAVPEDAASPPKPSSRRQPYHLDCPLRFQSAADDKERCACPGRFTT